MPDGAAAPRVGPLVFSTVELPQAQRLAAWNAAFGRLNAIMLPDPGAPALVRGEHWELGGALVSHNRITAARFERDPSRTRRDGLDHWVIRVLRQGENRLQHGGFAARLAPGQPVLFSMRESWISEWSDAEWVSLTLPRDLHPEFTRGLAGRPSGPLRGAAAGLLGATLLALPAQLALARAEELPALAAGLRGLLRGCLLGGAAESAGLSRKQLVREAIRRRMTSARLTPDSLATEVGLSRSALYRLFETEGGVAREIQAIRLAHAREALRDPARRGESVAAIGAAHGFPDPAVFSRSFRRAYGMPPGAVRIGAPPPPPAPASPRVDLSTRLYAGARSAAQG
jgi:AraC-like DNA-binding protein